MITFSQVFPRDVAAIFTDRSVDFAFQPDGPLFSSEQKDYLNRALGIAFDRAVNVRQMHGDEVLVVAEPPARPAQPLAEADAVVTNVQGLPITVRTADCLPVFLYDPKRKCVGLVHAGWRGSEKKITAKTVRKMEEIFGTSPADVVAALGPAIRADHYQVGRDFLERFPGCVQERADGCYLDLVKVNTRQLVESGVWAESIHDCRICTCCERACFSYRREGEKAGRHLSLMMLR